MCPESPRCRARRPPRRPPLDVAAVQAGLPPRAAAAGHGVRAVAARRGARRPDRAVAGAARQGRGRGERHPGMAAAIGLGVSATLTWLLRVISSRLQRRFRDRVTIALEGHVAGLQARVVTVAHQERPDYLDRLAVLRDQIFVLDHLYMSVFSTCGLVSVSGTASCK